MTAVRSRLDWLRSKLYAVEADGLLRRPVETTRLPDGRIRRHGRTLLDFCSNDYLGLSRHPAVVAAGRAIAPGGPFGATASQLVVGFGAEQAALCRTIASFERCDAAILYPTGYAANVGTLCALVGARDHVFCDRLNHASLVDGCRLSGAKLFVYRHSDLGALERRLEASRSVPRRWIVTDGVFGMDGTFAPLPELCGIADRHDALVVVDEAHGTGVVGEGGRGVCKLFGVEERVDVRVGTLSKAVGAMGGFVAGSDDLIAYLWNHARTQMFSTALPPAVCAAAAESFRLIERERDRTDRLADLIRYARGRLRGRGVAIGGDERLPIVPVLLDDATLVTAVAADLEAGGFAVAAIRPPTVPRNSSRLRISLNADHTTEAIDGLADRLARALDSH